MTLKEARIAFTSQLALLILKINSTEGYTAALAEVMDRVTAKDPTTDHMKGSLHEIGLAADIDLYFNGIYCTQTEDHLPFGEWWEERGKELGLPLVWGGRFNDGNHYSLRWEGHS